MCPPLLRGRYPTSLLLWGHPTSSGASGFLPVYRLCHPTSWRGRTQRTSRVPDSAVVTGPGLRPRGVRRSPRHSGSLDVAFRLANGVGTHGFTFITGLHPFTLAHCGPPPPCVRCAAAVTDYNATRGTQCLARASGAGTCLRLTKPSLARRTSNGTKTWEVFPRSLSTVCEVRSRLRVGVARNHWGLAMRAHHDWCHDVATRAMRQCQGGGLVP
jgi:hypothetical protein